MLLHSEKLQRPGLAQCGAHMVVSEGLVCQNMFLSIFSLFFRSPTAPLFFSSPDGRELLTRVTEEGILPSQEAVRAMPRHFKNKISTGKGL